MKNSKIVIAVDLLTNLVLKMPCDLLGNKVDCDPKLTNKQVRESISTKQVECLIRNHLNSMTKEEIINSLVAVNLEITREQDIIKGYGGINSNL